MINKIRCSLYSTLQYPWYSTALQYVFQQFEDHVLKLYCTYMLTQLPVRLQLHDECRSMIETHVCLTILETICTGLCSVGCPLFTVLPVACMRSVHVITCTCKQNVQTCKSTHCTEKHYTVVRDFGREPSLQTRCTVCSFFTIPFTFCIEYCFANSVEVMNEE